MNYEHRVKFLEDKLIVIEKEVSEVLREMQVTVETLAKTLHMAMQTMHVRLVAVEKAIPADTTPARTDEAGKDL